jgi:CheY-like chemotaxis protein
MIKARILLVHTEHADLTLLALMLKSLGYEIEEAATDRVAVHLNEPGGVDLMLAGAEPEDVDALELLSYMRREHRQVPVILLFSRPMPDLAKQALRRRPPLPPYRRRPQAHRRGPMARAHRWPLARRRAVSGHWPASWALWGPTPLCGKPSNWPG